MGYLRALPVVCLAAVAACTSSPTAPTPSAPTPAAVTVASVTVTPNRWDLPPGGGSLELIVATSANATGSVVAPNVDVTLQASRGTLSNMQPRTDATGHARVTWTGTSSAIVTAAAGGIVATSDIRVAGVAPTPTPSSPAPSPSPSPSPTPTPTPSPSAGPLFVDITASPRLTDEGTPVAFSATVRGATGTPGPTGLAYAWDFTEDGLTDSTSATPTFLFRARDHWTVTVFIRSSDGREGLGTIQIVVGAIPAPVVSATVTATPATIVVGQSVTFTAATSSNNTAGPVTSYGWDFGDGASATTSTPTTSHLYAAVGAFTASLTATTGNGTSGRGTTAVRVNDLPLTVGISASGPMTASTTVTFTATVSSAGSVPTSGLVYKWEFTGDTTPDFTKTDGPTSAAGWTFNTPATYTVTVTVTAPDGRTATNTIAVPIS